MVVFVLQWLSLKWEIMIMFMSQFPLTLQLIQNGMPHFIARVMTILVLIGMVFMIIRDVPWEDIFKLKASAAASEFCEWVQVGINVYIPHRRYQVKPHLHGFQLLVLLP